MITLNKNILQFRFPKVERLAGCNISFERTLRIPDDNQSYPLPPGMDTFPLEHVDDYPNLPATYQKRGGVFLPMYQSEAMWISFDGNYPCAVKIAAGKINAVSGEQWSEGLNHSKQDYIVSSDQPWLDGFNVSDGMIRQFVAMPLGQGYTAEEQLTSEAEFGGLQIAVYPMKAELYQKLRDSRSLPYQQIRNLVFECRDAPMGLAPGGLMKQEIEKDEYGADAWDIENGTRCFIHIVNSEQYQHITGALPPHQPMTAQDYDFEDLPWFDYYSEGPSVEGSDTLKGLKSVGTKMIEDSGDQLDHNQSFSPNKITTLRKRRKVREGSF